MKNPSFLRWNHRHQSSLLAAVFLSLFMLLATLFVACDKESPLAVDDQSDLKKQEERQETIPGAVKIEVLNLETAQYSYQGKLLKRDELERIIGQNQSAIMVAVAGLSKASVVNVFDSQEAFDSWTKAAQLTENYLHSGKHTSGAGNQKLLAAGGLSKLWDSYYYSNGKYYGSGANRNFPSPSSAPTLGTFDNKASFVQIYAGIYMTACDLFQNPYYNYYTPGWRLILINSVPGSLWQVILSGGYNNTASSVKVY